MPLASITGFIEAHSMWALLLLFALLALESFGLPVPGETALIHAAAGGVGLLLVQMAKKIGARVIGTAGTKEKAQLAREAGADLCLSKPCLPSQLARVIRAMLVKRS